MDERTTNALKTDEAASSNEEALNQETTEASDSSEPLEIPKKFVNKSPQDILRSYNDLEKNFHKVSSERAEERKAREAMEQRVRDLESRMSQPVPQQQVAQASQDEEDLDPLAGYDERFDENPKDAIKVALTKAQLKAQREAEKLQMQREMEEASAFYHQQKAENQDFKELEPKMQQIAQEYADLVRPNRLNSVKALKLLHLAARGASVDKYVGDAVKRAKNEGQTIRQEKKAAFSESTRAVGEDKVRFEDLSLDEMAKVLGRADD